MSDRLLYSLPEAAKAVGYSVQTMRRAIHATDPTDFPPPLRCKREKRDADGNPTGPYRVEPKALEDWVRSLPDG